uniref:hypothetical protein n=1 Tax=Aeromonas rivipollensis TaxID=948519 RepID=UPI003D1F7411
MSQLPEGWVNCKLGDVVDYGQTVKADMTKIDESTWVLELEDLEKDSSKILQRVSFGDRKPKSAKNSFEAGDVLYGKLRANSTSKCNSRLKIRLLSEVRQKPPV